MSRRVRIVVCVVVGSVLLALIVAVMLRGSASHPPSSGAGAVAPASGFYGAALPRAVPPHEFALTDPGGETVHLSAFRGRVTILAFLYSSCGSTCEVIAQQIRGALDELARPVAAVFVSADPGADTPAQVARFLARVSLSGRVRYLTGPRAALRRVWRAYGVVPATSDARRFKRAASVMLIDRAGRERVIFGLEQLTPEGLAHDVRVLSR